MFRMIGKWLISRAIERDRPPRGMLRRWIDHDEELFQFEAALQGMLARLRGDAGGWLGRDANHGFSAGERRPLEHARCVPLARSGHRIARPAVASGLAACLVIMALLWPALSDQGTSIPTNLQERVAREGNATLTPDDRAQLMAAWQLGRAQIEAWQARATDVPRKLENVPWSIAPVLPARWTGAATKRVHAALEMAVVAQRQELADGMKSAITFISRRLPASVAHLVGLQEG